VKDLDEVPPQFSYLLVCSSRCSLVHDDRNVIRGPVFRERLRPPYRCGKNTTVSVAR
jgi:hypothetical protein